MKFYNWFEDKDDNNKNDDNNGNDNAGRSDFDINDSGDTRTDAGRDKKIS